MSLLWVSRLIWFALFGAITLFGLIEARLTIIFVLSSLVLGAALIALSWIDSEKQRLPNVVTYPLIAAGLLQAALFDLVSIQSSVIGAIIGYGVFWFIGEFYMKLRGRDGLGLGDAKLLAAAGAWTGAMTLPLVIFIGSVLTIPFALFDRAEAFSKKIASFGPWLGIGLWFVWIVAYGVGGLPLHLTL